MCLKPVVNPLFQVEFPSVFRVWFQIQDFVVEDRGLYFLFPDPFVLILVTESVCLADIEGYRRANQCRAVRRLCFPSVKNTGFHVIRKIEIISKIID